MQEQDAALYGPGVDDAQEEHGEVQRAKDVAHVLDAVPVLAPRACTHSANCSER